MPAGKNQSLHSIVGFTAGLFSGLLGIGGGFILVPALIRALHYDFRQASALSLAAIIPIAAASAAFNYFLYGLPVSLETVLVIVAGGSIGSIAGSIAFRKISGKALWLSFSLLLLAASLEMMGFAQFNVGVPGGFGGIGALAGLLASLFGIGGGILLVPALTIAGGMDAHAAVFASLLAIVPIAAISLLLRKAKPRISAFTALLPAAFMGAFIGAALSAALNPDNLERLFGLVLLAYSLLLITEHLFSRASALRTRPNP